MSLSSRVTAKRLLFLVLVIVLAFAAAPSAKGDTISYYNVSGLFGNGQTLSGQISVNSFGVVTGYALNLTGALNTATCSGFCALALGTFKLNSGWAGFSGSFLTSNFTLTTYSGWSSSSWTTKLASSTVSVPEELSLIQALLVLLAVGLVFFLRKDRLAQARA